MERSQQQRITQTGKRRITLTLPAGSLTQAKRIARARKVNLSTVISEALANGLRNDVGAQRSEEVLSAYRKAFSGLSDEEMLLLDGIMLDWPATRL